MSNQGWGQSPDGFGPAPGAGGFGQPGDAYRTPGPLPGGEPNDQERMWALLAHLGTFVFGFVAPLLLMFIDPTGTPSPFVKHHAKQSLIWVVATIVVAMLTCGIGALGMAIFQILAAMAAHRGEWYVYPGCRSFSDLPPE